MATYDWTGTDVIPNGSGSAVRADLNDAFLALFSQNSSPEPGPPETVAYMTWADTTNGLYKIRNAANSGWITLYQLDGEWTTIALENGTAAAPSLYFKDSGTDTGVYSPGTDQVAITTAGVQRVNFNAGTEVVFNDGGADVDFRVEGDTNPNLFKIDAGLDEVQVANLNGGPLAGTRNRLVNGEFSVAQRGASFTSTNGANNDDTYTLDRWYILSDGNDAIDVTQETSTVPTNQKYAIALDVETINKKFGIAQIIEHVNCVGMIGGNATLSFKAKVSSTTKLDNVKAAIVAWSGTADSVTSDIISAWNVEGTNPTLIANATYENTPANLNVTTTYATYTLTANIDTASTKNIIVFIWSDVTDTTLGDFLYITDVQLEPGTVATPFERRSYGQELALCQRYFCKTFDQSVQPAQNTGNFNGALTNLTGSTAFTGNAVVNWRYPVLMRATPTIFLYTPGTNTSFTSCFTDSGGTYVAASATNIGETACLIYSSGGSASLNSYAHIQAAASIEL